MRRPSITNNSPWDAEAIPVSAAGVIVASGSALEAISMPTCPSCPESPVWAGSPGRPGSVGCCTTPGPETPGAGARASAGAGAGARVSAAGLDSRGSRSSLRMPRTLRPPPSSGTQPTTDSSRRITCARTRTIRSPLRTPHTHASRVKRMYEYWASKRPLRTPWLWRGRDANLARLFNKKYCATWIIAGSRTFANYCIGYGDIAYALYEYLYTDPYISYFFIMKDFI